MRTFSGYRPNPPEGYRESGVAAGPGQVQYEGVLFSDGSVVIRWATEYRSHSVWADFATFWHVHGHPEYGTYLEWTGDAESDEIGCRSCGLPQTQHSMADHPIQDGPVEPERPVCGHGLSTESETVARAAWELERNPSIRVPEPQSLPIPFLGTPHSEWRQAAEVDGIPLVQPMLMRALCRVCATRWVPGPWVCPSCGTDNDPDHQG